MPRAKCLAVTVLLALCVGLSAGVALATDSWNPTAETIPATLIWDQGRDVSVTAENDGSLTPPPPATWDTTYSIISVQGVTAAAEEIDRWGVTSVAVAGLVPPTDPDLAGRYTWDFRITAPPISTLTYALPVTPTRVASVSALDCNWAFAREDAIFTDLPTSENPVSITRFSDSSWATAWIEQCAGRVPLIVGGYGGGQYRPNTTVTRDQMTVFVQRAFGIPLVAYTGRFSDVPIGYWADDYIESCYQAGIVGGYANTYRPVQIVNRDAMTVFVARAMAGGDPNVPTGPATATFIDVPTDYWAYDYIEYCAAHAVIGGYVDQTYRPVNPVDRGQMAVFMYRAAIQPTGAVVVLAGPGVTAVDPGAAEYDGWSVATVGEAADPGFAYIGIDAVRAPAADIEVGFELRGPTTPTPTETVTITAGEVATAKTASEATGNPYLYAIWDLPTGLEEGDYTLVVSIDGTELARRPAFTIGTPAAPPAPTEVVLHPASLITDNGTLTSGTVANLGADDGSYAVWTAGATGLAGAHYTFNTALTPAEILNVKVEITYMGSDPDVVPINLMTSGATGGSRYCATADNIPLADTTFTWETANTAKIADMFQTAGTFDVIFCSCDDVPGYQFDLSIDEVQVTFTLR